MDLAGDQTSHGRVAIATETTPVGPVDGHNASSTSTLLAVKRAWGQRRIILQGLAQLSVEPAGHIVEVAASEVAIGRAALS